MPYVDQDNFVSQAQRLDRKGSPSAALDLIYDGVDELLHAGEFAKCSAILRSVSVGDCSMDILLVLLTTTLPAKTRLPARTWFFHQVAEEARKRTQGKFQADLLEGLA